MSEKLLVRNKTKSVISLRLFSVPSTAAMENLSQVRMKRMAKAGFISITLGSMEEKELVSASGVCKADIEKSSDFNLFVKKGVLEVISEPVIDEEEVVLIEEEELEELIEEVPAPVLEIPPPLLPEIEEPSILKEDDKSSESDFSEEEEVTLFSRKRKTKKKK